MENEKAKEKVKGNPLGFMLYRIITVAIILLTVITIKYLSPSLYKTVKELYSSNIAVDMSAETLLSEDK